jgi:predicted secreted protein
MRTKKILVALISSLAIAAGCASKPVTVMVKDSGESIVKAKAGKTVAIQLKSQLSTGYSWKVMEMPEALTLVKENVITDAKTLDITGGYEIQEFIFKASKTGGLVILKYGEHWKKKPQYINTASITIVVE